MAIMTIICGGWSLLHFGAVIRAGGVGKNGSTVAVSVTIHRVPKISATLHFVSTQSTHFSFLRTTVLPLPSVICPKPL
uniref:Putative secreted protein n=1 Tax=Anopheles darlingi TaxID=43151 RepID=A0A2M4DP65_ANODA